MGWCSGFVRTNWEEDARMPFAYIKNLESDGREIARIVSTAGAMTTVEAFLSPIGPRIAQRVFRNSEVEILKELPSQTQVYARQGTAWRLARVLSSEVPAEALPRSRTRGVHYLLGLPNNKQDYVPESDIFVRWRSGDEDPSDNLAAQITETPFFSEGRRRLASFEASQRAAFRGVTALAAAAIDFHPHQLATVSRVLSDPVQRYLLADEVGLGKTIETGILVRQYLLDEGASASALILVPEHLVYQWTTELREKFGIADDERVRVAPFGALDAKAPPPAAGLLVVDEAHRTAEWASRPNDARYYRLCELAKQAPKVLLLSGTPVIHNEAGFLAMLHLLDPAAYPLTNLASFQHLVQNRRPVAEALSDLTGESPDTFVRESTQRIRALFPLDHRLKEHADEVLAALTRPIDLARRSKAIQNIRTHLIERYRLDRRLLRTHRGHPLIQPLLPRRNGLSELRCAADPWRKEADGWLDDWRTCALQVAPKPSPGTSAVFAEFVAAAISHPLLLARAFDARLARLANGDTLAFAGESDWLGKARTKLSKAPAAAPREGALTVHLDQCARRAVIFVDDTAVAQRLIASLRASLKAPARVLVLDDNPQRAIENFWAKRDGILVCDRRGEDGINLQREPVDVIFFDFPIDPGRLEQRLGRVDRLDGRAQVAVRSVATSNCYEQAWVDVVRDAIGLFERSVAPLQYVLAEAMLRLRGGLLTHGPDAFVALGKSFTDDRTGLREQLSRIRSQEELDAPDWDLHEEKRFVSDVEAARKAGEAEAGSALGAWLESVQFWPKKLPGAQGLHFVFNIETGATLLPVGGWLPECQRFVDQDRSSRICAAFGPFVFRQEDVEENEHLLQLGHPFFDQAVRAMRRDDRGKSWAFWRRTQLAGFEEPRAFVRFEFVIESDVSSAQGPWRDRGSASTLRRRANAMFPPEHVIVWLSSNGDVVQDPTLLTELSRPYDQRPGLDLNLRPSRWVAAESRLNGMDWQGMVLELRRRAESYVRNDPTFQDRCQRSAQATLDAGQRTLEVLQARADLGSGGAPDAAKRAITFERELTEALAGAARNPRFDVRSAGAVFLCSGALEPSA
jgi:ATP-dependent helicase HepA